MPGVGQPLLPRPNFSSDNPYWRNPADRWGWVMLEARPKLTAQDFLFATSWEMWRKDIHGACLVRQAMMRSFWVNMRFSKLKYKEKVENEKAA